MEQVQPGCFLCAVITQPLVAARISAQNETYLRWGGWGRTALGIAGESPQPCEDLERKARPFRGTPKILKSNIYTVYIIYILYICIKDGIMEATVTYKKKIIDLKEDTFKALSVMAARQGTNLKKLIENLLDKTAEEYDDSEAYRYMTENYPDGKVKLEKNERKEFMDWLGVVEK